MTRSNVQLGGHALKLDADGDTTIQVSSDDVFFINVSLSHLVIHLSPRNFNIKGL